jgi:tetratricopeptide (TPR) repeat protein
MSRASERVQHLRELARLDDAEREARKALAAQPQDAELLAELSHVLYLADRPREGEEAASAAIAVEPDNAYAHRRRAYNLAMLQRYDEAVEAARASMSLDPHNPRAIGAYADALDYAGRLEEAEQAAHRAADLAPESPWPHSLLGRIKERRRQLAPALSAYTEAARLAPENPEFRRRIAALECRTGHFVRGFARYVEVARMDPARWENIDGVFRALQSIYRRAEFAICVATFAILGLQGLLGRADVARVGVAVVLGFGVVAVCRGMRILPVGAGSVAWTMWRTYWLFFLAVPMCVVLYIVVVVTGLDELLWYVVPGLVVVEVLVFTAAFVNTKRRAAAAARSPV